MTSQSFCYWLQGFFEIEDPKAISAQQLQIIKNHLNLVFVHEIDPIMGNSEHQNKLNAIHNYKIPENEKEAIEIYGPKPSNDHLFNVHGWYDPKKGIPRC